MADAEPVEAREPARWERIGTAPNADPRHDYLVDWQTDLSLGDGSAAFRLRYIPDRDVIVADGLTAWVAALAAQPWPTLEALAIALLEDVNNAIIPRWAEVVIEARRPGPTGGEARHRVVIEDRMPGWHNPELIKRLEKV